jgi:conjugal transfer pilus assembly protein TraB
MPTNAKSAIPGLKSAFSKQMGAIVLVALGAWGGLYLLLSGGPEKINGKHSPDEVSARDGTTTNLASPGDQVDSRDRWIGNAGKTVADHEARLSQQERQTRDIMARFLALEKSATAASANAKPASPPTATPAPPVPDADIAPNAPKDGKAASSAKPMAGDPKASTTSSPTPKQFPGGSPMDAKYANLPLPGDINRNGLGSPVGANGRAFGPGEGNFALRGEMPGIGIVKVNATDKTGGAGVSASTRNGSGVAPKVRQEGTTFLPIGFVPVRLLGGIDAPTGGQAQSNPLPVVLEITDMANLPNRFRANVKQCMVIGAAVGDLSSERSYIRTELLSCIRHDGRVLEAKVHGSVYGEDGKLGMRGRLVTKQGQLLANSLLAGVVGGIGHGLSTYTAQTATTITDGTSAVNVTPGKYAEAGIGGGVGQALDRLANYYISLAEKTFPVIEIDAQRNGDLAFTQGIELDTPLPEVPDLPQRAFGRHHLSEDDDEE